MTKLFSDRFSSYILILFIAVMGIVYTFSVKDGDFYWHASTGRWILENLRLPDFDPFSYSMGQIDSQTVQGKATVAILKGYWLGQVLLYLVWKMAAETGVIILRTSIYTLILTFTALWTLRKTDTMTALILVALQGGALCFFPNERPQIFAYLLFPCLLYILERMREDEQMPRLAFLLPLVSLVWGNIHGSSLLAALIILIYLGLEILRCFRSKPAPAKIAVQATAVIAAFVNPVSVSMIWLFLKPHNLGIIEAMTPVRIFLEQHNPLLPYWGFLLLSVIALGLALFRQKLVPEHLLVIGCLLYLTFTGSRYIGFAALAAPLLTGYVATGLSRPMKTAAAVVAILLAAPAAMALPSLKFREDAYFPKGAVSFIKKTHPDKNLFNFYDWGGYLTLYAPEYKVFIDGRMLSPDLKRAHDNQIANPLSLSLLDGYNVNTVLIPVFDSGGERLRLPYTLLANPNWFPVYSDDNAVVFLRNTAINKPIIDRFAIAKDVNIKP